MKVLRFITHDGEEFICKATKENHDTFLKNYRTDNMERLKAIGHTTLIPEIREEEMSEDEYNNGPVSFESAMYFNGIDLSKEQEK